MERLTIKYEGLFTPKKACTIDRFGEADDCDSCDVICDFTHGSDCANCIIQECFTRLGDYENTGFTPPEIMELKDRDTAQAPEPAPLGDERNGVSVVRKQDSAVGQVLPGLRAEANVVGGMAMTGTETLLMDYIMRHTYSCPIKDDADIDFDKECVGFKEPGCRDCIIRHLEELK